MAAIKKSGALLALTQAALALPGVARAEVQTDYLFGFYQEADVPAARTASGRDEPRYEIQTHMFRAVVPQDEQTWAADLTYETMSGASPWFVQPDAQGHPVQVMSGASIRDERVELRGNWATPARGGTLALSAGVSDEDDYRSVSGGAEYKHETADRQMTWSAGAGYSSDTITPTRGRSSPRVIDQADKSSLSLYGGFSFVLDARTLLQTSLSFAHHDGYLSDPYKLAWIQSAANTTPDARPSTREAGSVGASLRRYFDGPNAALHADYRYSYDSWRVQAHTLELAWQQELGDSWRLAPSLRWYAQTQAYFYAPYYATARDDGLASSDYRLSSFGALSGRLDLTKAYDQWSFGAGVEWYRAGDAYGLRHGAPENPGLVEYLSGQLRLAYRFE